MKEIPNYIYKLPIPESAVAKAVNKILEDFNIFMDEENALKLFYSLIVNLIYHIDTHPGQYFKLKYIDITANNGNLLEIRSNKDMSDDIITPQMLYDKYCSEAVIKEELQKSIDLFAKSFLGIREEKRKELHKLEEYIKRKKDVSKEIKKCTEISKNMTKYKKQTLKQRRLDSKKVMAALKKKVLSSFASNAELKYRKIYEEQFQQLERELKRRWMLDKNDFPL